MPSPNDTEPSDIASIDPGEGSNLTTTTSSPPTYQATHRLTFTNNHGTFNLTVSDYDTGRPITSPSPQLQKLGWMFTLTKDPRSTWASIGGVVSWYDLAQEEVGGCQLSDPTLPGSGSGSGSGSGTGARVDDFELPVGEEFEVIVRQRVRQGHQYDN